MPRNEVFLDTSYAIALSSPNDEHNQKALLIADQLEADGTRLITTRAVILEIGNAPNVNDQKEKILKPEEEERLLASIHSIDLHHAVQLALTTGMREMEILGH